MKSIFYLPLIFLLFSIECIAQNHVWQFPHNYQNAYKNQTRSTDGKPGSKYWINHADYKIDVIVDPETGLISGSANITYFNNSPDTLNQMVFRLYQDIYKKGNSRQFAIGNEDLTDGTQISRMEIGNIDYEMNSSKVSVSATNMIVNLDIPIAPNSEVKVQIEWNFKMPQKRWIRFGQYSSEHLLVAYWYPQIAVYDDIDGWDRIEYAGMVEFYNDPNNFEVNITVPSGFVVWGTGELQNPEKVFQTEIVDRFEKAKTSDEVLRIMTQEDYKNGKVTKSGSGNVWKFKAVNVPDFAFATSTGSNWDAVSLVVDPQTRRRVLISAVYPDSAVHYEDVAMITRNAVEYMSFELPGEPFPYPQTTVFANGRKTGGMEFPMMANDGAPDDYADLVGLTYHEVFHNYFPFFMGTNERKYAFMDEGWARYFPTGFLEKYEPQDAYFQRSVSQYENFAGSENELPPMIPTYIFNDYQTQRMAAYTRPAVAYHLLRLTLGDDLFKTALHEYISRWNRKHPMPYDFFNTFNDVAGEDLSWFWQPWFFEKGYPDLAIKELSPENILVVEKIGSFPVPVEIKVFYEDGTMKQISENASVWADGKNTISVSLDKKIKIEKIELGNDMIPDSDRSNNLWKVE